MLQFAKILPYVMAVIAGVCGLGMMTLVYTGHWGWAIPVGILTVVIGMIAQTGFLVQRKVESVTDTAIDIAGTHVERVADAVIERVKKS